MAFTLQRLIHSTKLNIEQLQQLQSKLEACKSPAEISPELIEELESLSAYLKNCAWHLKTRKAQT